MKTARIRMALISVSDKTGLPEFAGRLAALGVRILSTGGTARLLRERGLDVQDVSDYTGFPEILDGSLKTLHPKVHGGVLARRDVEGHVQQMADLGITAIDMVVVNLYPFEQAAAKPGVELMEGVDSIDIAGPTMIRSAVKNYVHVAVLTSPAQYDDVASELARTGGALSQKTLFTLAVEALRHTAHYDTAISDYLAKISPP